MADVDDLFVTHAVTEEDPSGAPEGENEPQEATAEEVAGDVTGLVPLCARHQNGPQLTTATFGYDIAQMEKRPWAEPGAKLSDYFNYGFNEDSWRVYCAMQRDGEESLVANAEDVLQKMQLSVGGQPSDGNVAAAMAPSEMGRYPQPGAPYGGNVGGGGGGRYGGPEEGGYHAGGGFHGANYKTKLCQRYQEGRCARGSECNYAHGAHELRPAPGGGVAPMGGYAPMGEGQQGMYPTPSGAAAPPHQPPQAYQMPYFQPGHGAPPVNFQAPDVPSGDGRYLAPPKRSREETY